ncbi:S1C family serine protease [Paenibacillus xylaniclasticus]|uniref:S1C family serine protease n=1 Tax=Paenibacillus xylaniclasticus TaxID=588083 RepID=UPI000FDAE7BA|nr:MULTISPECIES: trypsin-like peptidase domain-containing protein [Paenibacillus]GFN32619.1 protease [Paenibacillus curdlanolyticus]
MSKVLLRLAAAAIAVMIFAVGTAWAAGGSASNVLSFDAKIINGEVYVKASAVTSTFGGSGTYDSKTGKYSYTPANQVTDVVKKVSPSVVAIIGKVKGYDNRNALAHGTGVVWKSDGQIVTNAHVVKDLSSIVVVTADGKQFNGKTLYIDETSDLAVVKVNASGLKPAVFASLPLNIQEGEQVVAIGTPVSFSLRNTATSGILSGMNRSVSSYYQLLQTDAAINPGNSGGPLVNMKGEVIGINSMKFVSDDVDNLGFSIPMDTVQYVLKHFTKYGKVNRASLGVELEESWSAIVGLPTTDPLTVTKVVSDAAKKAGIAVGDELYSVAGVQVSSIVEVNELLKGYLPEQTVEVTLLSDGDLVTKKLKLSQWKQ